MSIFGRRRDDIPTIYVCPGCNDWQLEVSRGIYNTAQHAINEVLNDHRRECPQLSAIYSRALARQVDKAVPVAPALPASDAVEAIEAEITELARLAARTGRASRHYETRHARINELLDWRDEVIAAEKVEGR